MRRSSRRPQVVEDLREKLNRKRQEKLSEESGDGAGRSTGDTKNIRGPPPDPPSLLRDPLRDEDTQADNNEYRSRLNRYRGLGEQNQRYFRRGPRRGRSKRSNIIVEFSDPGYRTCTLDEATEVSNEINSERGGYRGRSAYRGRQSYTGRRFFRGYQRNRGNRYESKASGSSSAGSNLQEVDNQWDNNSTRIKQVNVKDSSEQWVNSYEVSSNLPLEENEERSKDETQCDDTDNLKDWKNQYEKAQAACESTVHLVNIGHDNNEAIKDSVNDKESVSCPLKGQQEEQS